jgi:plasmid stability protein
MKKQKETILTIRTFPADLFKALKVKAAKEGKSLKEVCIEILSEGLERSKHRDFICDIRDVPKASKGVEV